MRKVIGEILRLLWKLIRVLFWKWFKPILGRVILISVFLAGLVVFLVILLRGYF